MPRTRELRFGAGPESSTAGGCRGLGFNFTFDAMLAFSTCWNSARHTDGAEMLQEIIDLGFEYIELGHGIRISLMPGIQKMFERGKVRFSSLHNFCPLP